MGVEYEQPETAQGPNAAAGAAFQQAAQSRADYQSAQDQLNAISQDNGPVMGQTPAGYHPVSVEDNPGHVVYEEDQKPFYNPDKMFAMYPPAMRDTLSTITDAGVGALHTLAEKTGLPIASLYNTTLDMADRASPAIRGTGNETHYLRDKGLNNQEAVDFMTNLLGKAGLHADPREAVSRVVADWGSEGTDVAGQALMFLAGAGGAAKVGKALEGPAVAGPMAVDPSLSGGMLIEPLSGTPIPIPTAAMPLAARGVVEAKNAVGSTLKNVGENALAHPGQVVASYVGSGIGAGAGQALGENEKFQKMMKYLGVEVTPELLSTVGSLIGGREGSNVASFRRISPAQAPGELRGRPVSGGAQVLATMPQAENFLNAQREFSGADVTRAISGYTNQVTNWLKNVAHNVVGLQPGQMLPSTANQAQKLREAAFDGYKRFQSMADNEYWSQVDRTPRGPVPLALQKATEVAGAYKDPASYAANVPDNFVQAIRSIGQKKQFDHGVQVSVPTTPNIGQMKDLVGTMRAKAASLGMAGDPASRELRANIIQMANALDEDMGNVNPGDFALQAARSFSNWGHKTFTNGPLGIFTDAMNSNTLSQQNAKDALTKAMGDPRFGAQLANQTPEQIAAASGLPGGTPDINSVAPDIQPRTGDWLKSMVADAFDQKLDPDSKDFTGLQNAATSAAQMKKYMKSEDFRNLSKAFPQLDAEFNQHLNNLNEAISESHNIRNSVFFKNANMSPEVAVDQLLRSRTKVKDADTIVRQFGNKPEVMESLQYGLVRKLGNEADWNAATMDSIMNSQDNKALFQKMFPGDKFYRFQRIIDAGKAITTKPTGEGLSIFGSMSPVETAGRVLGSFLTGLGGGHSIQVHSIGTKIGGNIMQRLFHIIPPEDMIQKALVDPRWERFLMSRLPTTMSSIRATNRMLGMMVGAAQVGNHSMMDKAFPNGDTSGQP